MQIFAVCVWPQIIPLSQSDESAHWYPQTIDDALRVTISAPGSVGMHFELEQGPAL